MKIIKNAFDHTCISITLLSFYSLCPFVYPEINSKNLHIVGIAFVFGIFFFGLLLNELFWEKIKIRDIVVTIHTKWVISYHFLKLLISIFGCAFYYPWYFLKSTKYGASLNLDISGLSIWAGFIFLEIICFYLFFKSCLSLKKLKENNP